MVRAVWSLDVYKCPPCRLCFLFREFFGPSCCSIRFVKPPFSFVSILWPLATLLATHFFVSQRKFVIFPCSLARIQVFVPGFTYRTPPPFPGRLYYIKHLLEQFDVFLRLQISSHLFSYKNRSRRPAVLVEMLISCLFCSFKPIFLHC